MATLEDFKKPYVSVIITAHNRKNFLKDAINSVLNQALDRSFYEIIVVKNFDDHEIDNQIEENKIIKFKARDDSFIGEDLAIGIENAKGEIISFLDDDDVFLPYKLTNIIKEFVRDPKLIYYKNNMKIIDKNANVIYKTKIHTIKNSIEMDLSLPKLDFKKIYNTHAKNNFNLSCLSIRKFYFTKYIDDLRMINGSSDGFFAITSMLSLYKIKFDNKILNLYRLHFILSSHSTNSKDNIDNIIRETNKVRRSIQIFIKLSKDTPIQLYVKKEMLYWNIRLAIFDNSYHIKIKDLLLYIFNGGLSPISSRFLIVGSFFISKINIALLFKLRVLFKIETI